MENRPRKKLSRKMIGICSGFALILSVVLGSLGFYTYYHNIVDQYQQYIDTIIHICRSYIDADDMKECIDTGVKSAQYEETQKFLDNIKNNSQVEFIYVIKPLNDGAVDNAMYVWNAVEEGEIEEFGVIDSLGDLSGEGFPADMAGHFLGAMDGGEKVTYLSNSSEEFGYVLRGQVTLVAGKRSYTVKKGDSFCLRPSATHYLENVSARPAAVLWVSTPPSF